MGTAKFSVENFTQTVLRTDLARPNLFEVLITPPASLPEISGNNALLPSLFCESTSLPGMQIATKRLHIHGENYPRAHTANYGESVTMTFLLDATMDVKRFFDTWLDFTVNRDTGLVSYPDTYQGTISVSQLMNPSTEKTNHDTSYTVEFQRIFPISVSQLVYDNNITNAIQRLDVTFEYHKWVVLI